MSGGYKEVEEALAKDYIKHLEERMKGRRNAEE